MNNYSKQKRGAYAIANIVGLCAVLIINYLAVTQPLNNKTTGELSDLYPNMFTPAGFTFSIWSIIYSFLIGFIIYQAVELFNQKKDVEKIIRISPYFLLNCLLNGAWLFAWHYLFIGLSVFIMFALLGTLLIIHHKLNLALPLRPLSQKLWLDIPFSLYLGWISIATIANITAYLVSENIEPFSIPATIWTIIMIIVGAILGLFMVIKKRNIVFGIVVCWALFGILMKRIQVGSLGSREIILFAQISIGIVLAAIVFTLMQKSNRTIQRLQ